VKLIPLGGACRSQPAWLGPSGEVSSVRVARYLGRLEQSTGLAHGLLVARGPSVVRVVLSPLVGIS